MQVRYAAGTKDVLDRFFNNKPLKKDDVIVEGGKMAAQYDAAAKDRNMEFESVSLLLLEPSLRSSIPPIQDQSSLLAAVYPVHYT